MGEAAASGEGMVVTRFPRAVREIEHVLIPLRDGVRLAARIWLPEDAETDPVPALLEYLPYRKRTGTYDRDALTHPYLAGHGYASVRVDIRGTGESDGILTDEYTHQEQDDALQVIAWLAGQPWCSGAVGMFGISWGGFNALQVAALRPPALRAIITLCSTDDRYRDDVHYMGGALLRSGFGWGAFLFGAMGFPPDPALVGERWRSMWLQRLNNLQPPLATWLQHPSRDAYWQHGSVCEDYGAIECPVFAIGGWTDGYSNTIPRLLTHLAGPRLGLIGPWAHAYPHFALPGPQIGFLQESLRWWDHWLKGIDTGIMQEPMLRAWMTESVQPAAYHAERPGRWVAEPVWPSPNITLHRLHLTDLGLLPERSALAPRFVCSPLTVGKHGGAWCPFGRTADQADDQQEDDALSLVFDTEPLTQRWEILGAPIVTLDVAADRPLAILIVRLCDVRPDGGSLRISFGVLDLTHRDGDAKPVPMQPGHRYRVQIQLNDAGAVFPAGHKMRIAISTAYWPMIWPSPGHANVTIFDGTLDIPLRAPIDADRALRPLPPAETAAPEPVTELGRGVLRIDRLGLELGVENSFKSHIEPGEPLSAMVESRQVQTIERQGWGATLETTMRMSCDADVFVLSASVRACEGDQEICQRDWHSRVPRNPSTPDGSSSQP